MPEPAAPPEKPQPKAPQPPVAPKPPEPAAPPAEAKDATVTYHNRQNSVKLVKKAAHDDATADLHDPVTGELKVSHAPFSGVPKEGHYTT